MKVLLIHNGYQARGGEDQVFDAELRLLRSHGHSVIVHERSNREIAGYRVHQKAALALKTTWAWDSQVAIKAILDRHRPAIAHFTNTLPLISPAAYYTCAAAGTAVVQSLHNYRLICPAATLYRNGQVCETCVGRNPWPGVAHACYRNSRLQTAAVALQLVVHRRLGTYRRTIHQYIALTEFSRQMLVRGGLPEGRIFVKPNFLDSDPGMMPRASTGTLNNADYALFVGRLSEEKGVATLCAAFDHLELPLRIYGDGVLAPEVKRWVSSAPERRQFMGHRPRLEVLKAMREARLLVFSSEWHEVMPMVIVEAFACGVPVVAAKLGATSELLQDGQLGTLYQPGQSASLAAAVREIIRDPDTADAAARRARRVYEERYTAETNYILLMEAYERALQLARKDQSRNLDATTPAHRSTA